MQLTQFRGNPEVIDGAWGSILLERAAALHTPAELMTVQQPDEVLAIGRDYVAAGARLILTNTFRANRFVLARSGLADRAAELNEAGARLSVAAAAGRALVFGSMGPSGRLLIRRDVAAAELEAGFGEQAAALARGGVDGLACETFFDLDELLIALRAAKSTGLPVVASMTFDSGPDRMHTMNGVSPERAAQALTAAGASAIGCNCGMGVEQAAPIVARLRGATQLPIWVKPNAGLPSVTGEQPQYASSPAAFARALPALIEAGADLIGGCCGTTPEYTAAMCAALAEWRRSRGRGEPPAGSQ